MAESGNNPPPKPWERSATSTGGAPFNPPSPGSTSDVVEASGIARPGEITPTGDRTSAINQNSAIRPVPTRPWMQQNYTNTYGGGYGVGNAGYGAGINYNTGYGYGGPYGGGLYGSNVYRGGGYGMYGGGNYGGGLGLPMGGYGSGLGPYGDQDPNNPHGQPSSPPGFWISLLRAMEGVVNFFGRIAMLVDQNTQAFHMFMTALLQLFDRSGMLYGELARFVLRLLGIRAKSKKRPPGSPGHEGPGNMVGPSNTPPKVSWEGLWDENAK